MFQIVSCRKRRTAKGNGKRHCRVEVSSRDLLHSMKEVSLEVPARRTQVPGLPFIGSFNIFGKTGRR